MYERMLPRLDSPSTFPEGIHSLMNWDQSHLRPEIAVWGCQPGCSEVQYSAQAKPVTVAANQQGAVETNPGSPTNCLAQGSQRPLTPMEKG